MSESHLPATGGRDGRRASPEESTRAAHYEEHLGPIYSWMIGGVDAATERARAELREFGIGPVEGGTAVDLGAGTGSHAIPLAEMGYSVLAFDECSYLLEELRSRAGGLDLRTFRADLVTFRTHLTGPADLILCMGDTLTHLPNRHAVGDLLAEVAAELVPGGVFLTTFRDYASTTPRGEARFIPVRSDRDRILTCYLEYGPERVRVHDLLHERLGNEWHLRVSSYPKLRLDPGWVAELLEDAGCVVDARVGSGGMVGLRAAAPRSL